jgi:hypothetical protein
MKTSQTPESYLDRAQAALSCLGYFAAYLEEEADTLPACFGFGLSVILKYIEDDVTGAHEAISVNTKEAG